eukprot:g3431.t1
MCNEWFTFVEDSNSSLAAQRLSNFMTFIVIASIAVFCLSTEPALMSVCDYTCFLSLDFLFVGFFTLEVLVRAALYQNKGLLYSFLTEPLNVIDILAIIPTYVEYVTWAIEGFPTGGGTEQTFLRMMKLMKIFRVFKLMKHFQATDVLFKAMRVSLDALPVPFFLLAVLSLLFGSFLWFLERGDWDPEREMYLSDGVESSYQSIADSIYFVLVTMTTTGYGDQTPATTTGKMLAVIIALFGILFLAMPLTIVGNRFYLAWNEYKETSRKKESELMRQKSGGVFDSSGVKKRVAEVLDKDQRQILTSYLNISDQVARLSYILVECIEHVHTSGMHGLRQRKLELQKALKAATDAHIANAEFSLVIGSVTKTTMRRLLRNVGKHVTARIKMKRLTHRYSEEKARIAQTALEGKGWKNYLYVILDAPELVPHSKAAKRVQTFTVSVILLSILAFVMESDRQMFYQPQAWFWIELTFTILFTFEFFLRLSVSPNRQSFSKDILNWFDLISIVPFYIEVVLGVSAGYIHALWEYNPPKGILSTLLRIVKLFRVLRVFKMVRQFKDASLIVETMTYSVEALTIPGFFLFVAILFFSSVFYYVESKGGSVTMADGTMTDLDQEGKVHPHTSILSSFWLVVITVTTVGYGDISPATPAGKVVGVFLMFAGIFYTAMPLAIVGTKFFDAYESQRDKEKVAKNVRAENVRKKLPTALHACIEVYMSGKEAATEDSVSIKSVKESIKLMREKLKELISDIGEQLEKEEKKKKKALKLAKKEKSNDNADSKSKSESDLESQSESESESESESSSSSSENEEGTRRLKFLRTSMLAHVQTNTKAERRAFESLSLLYHLAQSCGNRISGISPVVHYLLMTSEEEEKSN